MRDLRLFLISLLIACAVWAMHTFTLEYSATLPCSVRVVTNMEGYSPTSTARETMLLRGRASGFYLIKTRGSGRRAVPLEIHVDPRHFKPVEGEPDLFSLSAQELRERLDEQLGDRFVIDFIDPADHDVGRPSARIRFTLYSDPVRFQRKRQAQCDGKKGIGHFRFPLYPLKRNACVYVTACEGNLCLVNSLPRVRKQPVNHCFKSFVQRQGGKLAVKETQRISGISFLTHF